MMQKISNRPVLRQDDYELLISYLNGRHGKDSYGRKDVEDLRVEMKKARIVDKNDFPQDVVRLNSTITIVMEGRDEAMELVLVTPDKADIKEKKISIMSPIGTALIGFRQGQEVSWQVPDGKRTFTILAVNNGKE